MFSELGLLGSTESCKSDYYVEIYFIENDLIIKHIAHDIRTRNTFRKFSDEVGKIGR